MESELEPRPEERIHDLQQTNDALRLTNKSLAYELEAARRLQNVAAELINARGTRALFERVLDSAIDLLQADFASIQEYRAAPGENGELVLLGHRGFDGEAVRRWSTVRATGNTACAAALRKNGRVVITDLLQCDFLAGTSDLEHYLAAGVRSAQATPLFSRSGVLLGMVCTFWREPHEMQASEIRALDMLAPLAAGLIDRSRDEDRISESEARFRQLADAAPVMIWVAGPDKGATFFNKACLDFSGRTLQQKSGGGWIGGIHPEDRDWYLGTYNSSIEARREFRAVLRLRRYDGEFRWILCTGVPHFSPDGTYAGHIGSCIEINDQKLIEEGLRAREVRLLAAQRLAQVGSWERQLDGQAIHWSDEMLRILGLPNRPPANFAAFLQCVHAKDREKILEVNSRARSAVTPLAAEYRIVRPNGEIRFVRSTIQAISGEDGLPVHLAEAIQDITEHVESRERLRASEQCLKNAGRLAHVGHFQFDIRSGQVTGSEEMYRIFGRSLDFVPTYEQFLQDLVPADREEFIRLLNDSLQRKVGHSFEYRVILPDAGMRTISCVWEVLLDDEGAPERLFGACQDVTESRRAQQESFARQKLESVGTLASGIAHDFNNLLGAVLAQADLALAECDAGSYPWEELYGIRNVAVRGSEIVRQLMIYAGRETTVVGLVDLSRIVREMVELLLVSVSKRAALETDLASDLPPIRADAAQVRQLVMNLVTNASDALEDRDGVVRVSTKFVPRESQAGCLSFEVSDTGRGMTPETQAKIFDPFFTTKSAGHGLGLSVVQGIVRGLGGSILVSSQSGGGSTFQILLPCAEPSSVDTGAGNAATEPATGGFSASSLLIVEDEPGIRQGVARMLRKLGFEVLEAADGSSALALLRAHHGRLDVILLDMTIPGASSREVIAQAIKVWPEAKVILTSAYGQDMLAEAMSVPQVRGFVRKPFQLADLLKALRVVLSPQPAATSVKA